MIKPSELRIGNYVNVPRKDQSPFRIDVIEYLSDLWAKVGQKTYALSPFEDMPVLEGHPLTWELKDCEPISLTEEWLEKFEFKYIKSHDTWVHSINDSIIISFQWYEQIKVDFGKEYLTNIMYVHELQNLYYSLTKKELTLKP